MSEFSPSTILEQLFFTTVRVDVEFADGRNGSGTGFIFSREVEGKFISFIITNKHVINNSTKGKILFHIKKLGDESVVLGKSVTISFDNFENLWEKHPDDDIDIAALIITNQIREEVKQKYNAELFYIRIPESIIPTEDTLKDTIDAIEDILFIGYPTGIYDKKNLIPIARKGITATPIFIDYDGKPQFLIDGAVFPGSSGSPVFLCNFGGYSARGKGFVIGNRILFLGILSAAHRFLNNIEYQQIPTVKVPDLYSSQFSNLGIVYKSKLIIELIENIIKKLK